jgi:hypothetical protein
LSYESRKTRKRRIFLTTSYIQGQEAQEAKEAVESARAGLTQKRKEKRKTKEGGLSPQEGDVKEKEKEKDQGRREGSSPEGKVPCALNQEFLFWFTSIWVLRDPSRLKYWLLRDLSLQGSYVQRKFRKRTTLRSKSSTLKGLLYAG